MAHTLITGASGFIGSHVAARLRERCDEVRVTVRESSRIDSLERLGVETVRADIRDRRDAKGAARRRTGLSRCRDHESHAVSARGVLAERQGNQDRAGGSASGRRDATRVHLLGRSDRACTVRRSADESNVWDARYRIPYVDSKHEAEATAMRLLARGLPLVIVNPAHVMGAGDPGRSSTTIVKRFLQRQIPAYVDGTLNVVAVEDVAEGHLRADERGAVGERYILGNRNFTFDRLFADLARLSGAEPPPLKLPVTVALALAQAARRVPAMRAPHPVEIRAASLNWAFTTSNKARRELGWRPGSPEDTLQATIEFYRQREPQLLPARPLRQPLALRVAAGAIKRIGPGLG